MLIIERNGIISKVKLLYHPDLCSHLESYGITVPLRDDRSHRTYQALQQEFPGQFELAQINEWQPITKEELLLTHSEDFVSALLDKEKCESKIVECFELYDEVGNPKRFDPSLAKKDLSQIVQDILLQARGTLESMSLALDHDMCFFLGGGMHHAMKDRGRGFCLVNDIVLGIRKLQNEKKIKNAWVIDVDAHKGDGTAALTTEDESISTLSVHMEKGWPLDVASGAGPWHLPSTIDLPVASKGEDDYLNVLEKGLVKLSERYQQDVSLAIVVAGADPYERDILPSSNGLNLSLEQMLERDKLVYSFLKSRGISQCWLMAGGYGPDSWQVYAQFISFLMREVE